MAKYTITYRCGHTAEVQLFRSYKDRERKIAYYKTIDCPECRANKANEAAKENGYAVLTGSVKQVGWASDIRAAKMTEAEKLAAMVTKNHEVFDRAIETMKNETSASWWIDHRDASVKDMLKEILHI